MVHTVTAQSRMHAEINSSIFLCITNETVAAGKADKHVRVESNSLISSATL